MFRLEKHGDLWYYTINSFSETGMVSHCFTTRRGGVSENEYQSMNLRVNCDDKRENILKNYEIICTELGIDPKKLVLSKQVHGVDIADVTSADFGNGLYKQNRFTSADALVTAERGVPLVTFYADCVPVFLLDKRQGVLALIHSGWKGTAARISALCAEHMHNAYGTDYGDIIAAIGPSVQACHFEVGDEVADIFRSAFGDGCIVSGYEKPHINLQKCVLDTLVDAGIPRGSITDSGICTYCNGDMFYSHRRSGDKRGTMAAVAMLI